MRKIKIGRNNCSSSITGVLLAAVLLPAAFCRAAAGEDAGPDVVVVAEAHNPQPATFPSIRVVKEKLWGQYYPMVSMAFPNVPDFTCDAWCYESEVELVDARPMDGGAVEMRHRSKQSPQMLVITTITPKPGMIEFSARVEVDLEAHPDGKLPEAPPDLNLCWQLRHAPGFASKPDLYPEFVKRCFIFTDRGRTFLHDTQRTKIPVQPADHQYNNPPWVQMYVTAANPVPVIPPTSWAGYSPDRYLTPVIGVTSRDGKYLAAIANDSAEGMSQAWHDCAHNNPKWLPANGPVTDRRWRLCVYAMANDPKALLERVAQDFPNQKRSVVVAEKPTPWAGGSVAATPSGWIELAPNVTWLKSLPLGPFVRLKDGALFTVNDTSGYVSRDEGVTWESRPLFASGQNLKVGSERALVRTANDAIILVFMNMADYKWAWNKDKSLAEPGTRLPVWAIRSLDDGKTWGDAQMIYDGYCGDIHQMIQTRNGAVVVPVQELLYEDGRHALRPRFSTDDGKTWQRANLLDIGGRGDHDGLIEGAITQLQDGRLWLLCRTNLMVFWSAFSDNDGKDWRVLQRSDIAAASAPGTLTRLKSGRLMLVWNRPTPDGSDQVPAEAWRGGDRQWSDVKVSNYRSELSVAFSSDDGKTWSKPTVVARGASPGAWLAYSYVFEPQPGKVWITTMQGDVRVALNEADLVRP